jgi:flagellar basal body-associated protein FliL
MGFGKNFAKVIDIDSFAKLSKIRKILWIGTLGIALGVIAATFWSITIILRAGHPTARPVAKLVNAPSTDREPAATKPTSENPSPNSVGNSYQLKDLTLSFSDEKTGRVAYAQFSMTLELPSVEAQRWVSLNRARLLDSLHEVAVQFQLIDIEKPNGIVSFKKALTNQWKAHFGNAAPTTVEFQDWTLN